MTAILDDKHVVEASELKDHVHALVFELHKTAPEFMLYVLPRLCDYLEVRLEIAHPQAGSRDRWGRSLGCGELLTVLLFFG